LKKAYQRWSSRQGRYITNIPEHLVEIAQEHEFPLIEIPFQARFVDIARDVNERISQENMSMVERALTINQNLTRIVLEDGSLHDLAQALAELVGHSISIENERFEAIATQNIADFDEARRYTQLHGRTDPRLIDALEERGYLPTIRDTLRPLHLPPMPDVGLEMERLLAPIVVHGDIYGFIWIIADLHDISEIDRMAIESGATIAALMMLYQESVQSAEASLKGSLLTQLIQGNTTRETILTDQSLRYGVDLRSPYVMMVVDAHSGGGQSIQQVYRSINQLVQMDGWQAVVGQFAGQVVVLAQDNEHLRAMAARIQERVALLNRRAQYAPRVGISALHQGADTVKHAHEQCQDVLTISRRLTPHVRIAYFDDLGYLHTLYHAGKGGMQGNAFITIIQRLMDEKQSDLLQTLEAYLDAGGNGVNTADALHIHRSTLNYRLTRIVQICEVDLQDPIIRMNLQVAIKMLRLFGMTNGGGDSVE
jgi:purine catabolism regulator